MQPKSALLFFTLTVGCGGKLLDVGGRVPDTTIDGSVPGHDVAVPGWPVEAQRNPRSLRSEGAYLYWVADRSSGSAILRCEKRDCANTLLPLYQASGTGLATIEIRGATIYAVVGGIYSCPTTGCIALDSVVPDAGATAVAFDDLSVYWSHRNELKIYTCPLTGCRRQTATVRINGTHAVELAVDATALYWIAADAEFPEYTESIMFAPKVGSAPAKNLALRQNLAASLVVRDGFVFWTTSFSVGTVARCPIAGCPADEPEVLIGRQYFPQFVNLVDDTFFWMNGPAAPGSSRPVQIWNCKWSSCATPEMLDEGTGGSSGVRKRSAPPQEMVVDDDAIYWIGDVVDVGSQGNEVIKVDGSIRRTARRAK